MPPGPEARVFSAAFLHRLGHWSAAAGSHVRGVVFVGSAIVSMWARLGPILLGGVHCT